MISQFNPPQANILYRVLFVRGRMCGTAFILDHGNKQYLITANHVIGDSNPALLSVKRDSSWEPLPSQIIARNESQDVVVLKMDSLVERKQYPIELNSAGLRFGQFTFFLGYPFLEFGQTRAFYDGKMPLPYVKWAAVSMLDLEGSHRMILDGINNVGFSGGPVVFNKEDGTQSICGIVTGLKEEELTTVPMDGESEIGQFYKQNTGLIYCTSSNAIQKLIETNPVGTDL